MPAIESIYWITAILNENLLKWTTRENLCIDYFTIPLKFNILKHAICVLFSWKLQ
jgi:hypothetical protein